MTNSETSPPLLVEVSGAVLVITLNRPTASNALNPALVQALSSAFEQAALPSYRAVVIASMGKNFCAGADLAAAQAMPGSMGLRESFHPMLLALNALQKPVIAAVQGAAAGGGLSLALAADLRIGAEDARLVPGWVQIGLAPDVGASWFAPRLIGSARAFDWFSTGRAMKMPEALSLGLVNEIVPVENLLPRAIERAASLAAKPGAAVALTKRLIGASAHATLAEQLESELQCLHLALAAPERAEQVAARLASFANK